MYGCLDRGGHFAFQTLVFLLNYCYIRCIGLHREEVIHDLVYVYLVESQQVLPRLKVVT